MPVRAIEEGLSRIVDGVPRALVKLLVGIPCSGCTKPKYIHMMLSMHPDVMNVILHIFLPWSFCSFIW